MPLYDGGWHPTGDLGYIDEQQRLHFLGRDDNMIKSGGENVFPDEVAAVLLSIPQITDAVVLGIPNERMGATVAALVVCSDPSFSEKDIDTACRAALASYKIPRHIIFTDALPKLGSGKIDLTQCKQYFPDKSNFSAT
jgi:acyl-CoA synthetase (AMP-forming)/AMP-acid ligase II